MTANATVTHRRLVPSTLRTRGRAIASRIASRPIDAMTVRNIAHFATTRGVDVAPRAMCGITNCGEGPGFGPTANVKAPCTGWPSTEIARQ